MLTRHVTITYIKYVLDLVKFHRMRKLPTNKRKKKKGRKEEKEDMKKDKRKEEI